MDGWSSLIFTGDAMLNESLADWLDGRNGSWSDEQMKLEVVRIEVAGIFSGYLDS